MLSEAARAEIRKHMDMYPAGRQRSAVMAGLYIIQREFGSIPVEAQAELAAMLGLDPAEVGAVTSFYHMYNTEPKGEYNVEVCTNVPCMLRGAGKCLHQFEEKLGIHHGETTADGQFSLDHMECLGSCGTAPMTMVTERKTGQIRYFEELETPEDVDKVIALLKNGQGFTSLERWTPRGDPGATGKAAGPYRIGGMEQRYLTARVLEKESQDIETYLRDGGYAAARQALTTLKPEEVMETIKASGIRGRGGAGFPTGQKWSFLAPEMPRYLVVNADESEPGTFKDRIIMEYDPHQLIEGIVMSAYAIKAERAFIYIRGEYYYAYTQLVKAIEQATAKGFVGEKIFGTDVTVKIVVHRGAGAYECGEETALLSSLEGNRGHPRMKPPFPAVKGLYDKPTIVNNVETICNVTQVMRHGVEWYRSYGTEKSPGIRIFCVSGNVKYPGLYELPHSIPLSELLDKYAGGPQEAEAPFKAVVPGGLSMKMLDASQLNTPMDYEAIGAAGSALGSAGVIAIDARQSMVQIARRTMSFYREESCGKCTPCREGTPWLENILIRFENGQGLSKDLVLLEKIPTFISGKSFCPFGDAAVWGLQSNLAKFRREFEQHLQATNPTDEMAAQPVRPIYRPDRGQPSSLNVTALEPVGETPLNRDHLIELAPLVDIVPDPSKEL